MFDADPPEIKAGKLATLELFAEALAIYSEAKFAEATRLFSECWRHNQGAIAPLKFIGNTVTQFRLIATVPNSIAT
ncbi:hypothetical protein [Microcoleus sp. herbarium2]|uniref:hypothetical protein n=1 Tax=Microcoleus sp. herbarium2 TaxID=3055433 RepID=UPI002FD3C98D